MTLQGPVLRIVGSSVLEESPGGARRLPRLRRGELNELGSHMLDARHMVPCAACEGDVSGQDIRRMIREAKSVFEEPALCRFDRICYDEPGRRK